MRNWDTRDESGSDLGCEWEKDWDDVQKVCQKLDIPCKLVGLLVATFLNNFFKHIQIDLSREYWNNVFAPSLQVWESGATPNPDIWCNKWVSRLLYLHYYSSYPEK
jgi:tRNA-specific 2-thiouridylase